MMRLFLLAMPAVVAALVTSSVAPASRAVIAGRVASRPVMLVESANVVASVAQSGLADTLPMTLADAGSLVDSITSLPPTAQAVYYAVCLAVLFAIFQAIRAVLPVVLQAGFVVAAIELFGGIPPPL